MLLPNTLVFFAVLLAPAAQDPQKFIAKPSLVVPGDELRAILVAERAFQANTEIPSSKKDLSNYTIQIFKTPTTTQVMFAHRMLPEEASQAGGEGKLGVSVSFFINRKSWTVERVLFYQ